MNCSQFEFKQQLLILVEETSSPMSFSYMLGHCTLPEFVKLLVYELFLCDFYIGHDTTLRISEAYRTMQQYATELKIKGFVEFT